jgi:hypothetical protein
LIVALEVNPTIKMATCFPNSTDEISYFRRPSMSTSPESTSASAPGPGPGPFPASTATDDTTIPTSSSELLEGLEDKFQFFFGIADTRRAVNSRSEGLPVKRQPTPNEFWDAGGTRYKGRSSSKEADTAFKPATRRPNETDWPTIVLEAGFFDQLRNDAGWWLSNSRGHVQIVLIFSIKRGIRTIQIEKWETRPVTRSAQVPTQIQQITIDPNN